MCIIGGCTCVHHRRRKGETDTLFFQKNYDVKLVMAASDIELRIKGEGRWPAAPL